MSVTVKKLQTEQRKFSKFHDEVEKVRDAMSASEARLAIKTQKLEQLQSRNADFHRDLVRSALFIVSCGSAVDCEPSQLFGS